MNADTAAITHEPTDLRRQLLHLQDRVLWTFPALHHHRFEITGSSDEDGALDPDDIHIQIGGDWYRIVGIGRPGGIYLQTSDTRIHTQRELADHLTQADT